MAKFGSRLVAATLLAIAYMATPAHAVVLLSNLTSPVDGDFSAVTDGADNFTTGNAALTLTSVDIFWKVGAGGTSNQVGIFTDSGGLPGATQVGGFFTSGIAITDNATINYTGASISLAANTTYWMVVDVLDDSGIGFSFNQIVVSDPSTQGATIIGPNPGSAFGNLQTSTWFDDPSNLMYALNGDAATSIPESGTLAFIALGLAGIAGLRRKK
jgi:hypothetical protein